MPTGYDTVDLKYPQGSAAGSRASCLKACWEEELSEARKAKQAGPAEGRDEAQTDLSSYGNEMDNAGSGEP